MSSGREPSLLVGMELHISMNFHDFQPHFSRESDDNDETASFNIYTYGVRGVLKADGMGIGSW